MIGNIAVYTASGFILASTLVEAPSPQYPFIGYLAAIYTAYLPTQLPIAVGEMLVTGMALQYAYNQRPEVLEELGIVDAVQGVGKNNLMSFLFILALAVFFCGASSVEVPSAAASGHVASEAVDKEAQPETPKFAGMDEAVNEKLAEAAGRPPRSPYINTEEMGDLWNLLLLSAGGICGFIFGRYWHILWGVKKRSRHTG